MAIPPLGAVSSGIRFQVRLFWLHALPMLCRPGIERVELEHRDADGVDDVAVFYSSPGRNDAGVLTDADFLQAKFHVAESDVIDAGFFSDPSRTNTAQSLLVRMATTWSRQRIAYPSCRLTFLTNWNWDPADPLRRLVRSTGHIDSKFHSESDRSAVGKIRNSWSTACGLGDSDFRDFIGRLRFQVPWGKHAQVDEQLRDRMQLAGLKLPALEHECVALDDLGGRFLETGRTVWTPERLRAAVAQEGLFEPPSVSRPPIVAVRSFMRFAGLDLVSGDIDIDLTDLFEDRAPRHAGVWPTEVPTRLTSRLPEIGRLRQPVELALDCHLSIAWRFGLLLDPKCGVRVVLRQKGLARGTEIWEPQTPLEAPGEWTATEERDGNSDLVVAVSVTHSIGKDVDRSLPALGLSAARFVHLSLAHPNSEAITNGSHAAGLAAGLVAKLRELTSSIRPKHTHLFLSGPVAFAFLLGQRSGVLGPTTAYEFDFNNSRTYSPGMSSMPVSV
jgi:hypothetical protein